MKTPISYYGGKQKLCSEILPLLPPRLAGQYVEPFFGGGAIFWAKRPHKAEAINDLDSRVYNFWHCVKYHFEDLQWLVQNTMHSEEEYRRAGEVLKAGLQGNEVDFAWAFWVHTNMSFGKQLHNGFAFCNSERAANAASNKRSAFTATLSGRLDRVEIFNRDAIDFIRLKDRPETFFYLDPPYPESDAGHYDHMKGVYYELLELLPTLKGRWLLSSYPSGHLEAFRQELKCNFRDISQRISAANNRTTEQGTKTECLTWNYSLPARQVEMF